MKNTPLLTTLLLIFNVCISAAASEAYDFSYSYTDPAASGADDYIVSVTNAVLYDEGAVRAWKQDVGSSSFAAATPGVITYRFNFQETVAEAALYIAASTFHWSYSQGHAFIYGSRDGVNWVKLAEAAPPAYGAANTQVARSVPESVLGGRSLWFKVELYSYGESAANGEAWTNTAQHSRYDVRANNTTFKLDVNFSSGTQRQQCATYDVSANKVDLPCVVVAGNAYSVELSLYSSEPVLFRLTGIAASPGSAVNGDCAEFDAETFALYLPCLGLGGEAFTAGLQITSADPVLFGVRDVASVGPLATLLTNLYVHEDSSDPLVATFEDINNRYYAIYGVKDSNNVPLYYDRVETFTLEAPGFLSAYLTMEYDRVGRPTAFRLPSQGGAVSIEYLSDAIARVTVTAQGSSESVNVKNPFPGMENTAAANYAGLNSRPFEATNEITYIGDIISCGSETPTVTVQRNFDATLSSIYPLLARSFAASVFVDTYDVAVDYSYSYKITIPGDDFDAWSRWCKAGYFFDQSLGFIGVWKERVGDLASGAYALFQDYKAGSVSSSGRAVVDKVTDTATGGVPIISLAKNINDAWDVEGSGMNGPCSETAYNFKRQRLLHEQTITVDDGSSLILKKTYKPTASWMEGSGFVQIAPMFDFSDQCEEPPPPPTCDPVALARILTETECIAAGGYWWPDIRLCECP